MSAGRDTAPLWFLVRLAREFRRGGWVFTGFHWPVLAAQVAWRLPGERFVEIFEAGAALTSGPRRPPTSTTDYAAYHDELAYVGTSTDVLLGLVHRLDRAVLDASNVDLAGRINSTAIGSYRRPRVRLPGGGGAPDVAARSPKLLLALGSTDPARLHARVEHATAVPGPSTRTFAVTRWGVVRLGDEPSVIEWAPDSDRRAFEERLQELGVGTEDAKQGKGASPEEEEAALQVLEQATERGYVAARRMLEEITR